MIFVTSENFWVTQKTLKPNEPIIHELTHQKVRKINLEKTTQHTLAYSLPCVHGNDNPNVARAVRLFLAFSQSSKL